MNNKLYFGDNLDVLRSLDTESVDLIYLDPPFNYNVLFKEKSGEDSPSQKTQNADGKFPSAFCVRYG